MYKLLDLYLVDLAGDDDEHDADADAISQEDLEFRLSQHIDNMSDKKYLLLLINYGLY